MNPILFLGGYRTVRTNAENRLSLLNLCLQHGIPYRRFSVFDDGSVSFLTTLSVAHRLKRLCQKNGVCAEFLPPHGIPGAVHRLWRRIGLLFGGSIAVVLLILSSLFVWDIEITGNESMTREEILSLLNECSFSVGSYIPDLNIRELENRVLIASDRISWVAVNLSGTVARVQVIERKTGDSALLPPASAFPANLVATMDGQIEYLEIFRGKSVVKMGQAVKKGELLVSGAYDSNTVGYRFTRASGKVMARTEHTIQTEIPFAYTETESGKRHLDAISLNFFNFSLKIYKSSGNWGEGCAIIKEDMNLPWSGKRVLPVNLSFFYAQEQTERTYTREQEEALRLAHEALDARLADMSEHATLLSLDTRTIWQDDLVVLVTQVKCLENIAEQVEFEVRE